jgi:hypothetical protein
LHPKRRKLLSDVHALLLHLRLISVFKAASLGTVVSCNSGASEGGSCVVRYGLPFPLEEAAGPRDGHRLIQHPLADVQVLLDPDVNLFVLGNGLLLETGPMVP